MSIKNNTTDLSEMDFPVNQTSNANEMATSDQISKIENTDSNGCLDDILDLDERIKSDDTEEDNPKFPEEDYNEEPEKMDLGDFDELMLIAIQEQDEINAMIKGYPMRNVW